MGDSDSTASSVHSTRSSSRLTSTPKSYNESNLLKRATTNRPATRIREGSRKSRRINGRKAYNEDASSSDDDDDQRRYVQLKKLKNPTGPTHDENSDDEDEEEQQSDRMEDEVDDDEGYWVSGVKVDHKKMPLPTRERLPDGRGGRGDLIFEKKWSHFRPNLTPEEVLRGGAFGGGFFRWVECVVNFAHAPSPSLTFSTHLNRDHYSTILHRTLDSTEDIESTLPSSWVTNLDHETYLSNPEYNASLNRFGRKAGQSLTDWEKAGWIAKIDPRGWFQWYIRFYNGRRCTDDDRQVSRWLRACGPAGRFKRSVVTQIAKAYGMDKAQDGLGWDDEEVTPVIRQVCWQWAYELNQRDYLLYLPDK